MKIEMHGMKKVTIVSQAEILIRGPAKCNTVVMFLKSTFLKLNCQFVPLLSSL